MKMMSNMFTVPQRQSAVGILFIFISRLYKFFKNFWVFLIYLFIDKPTGSKLWFIVLAIVSILILVGVFSYISYRKFKFHIDYKHAEFILTKGVFSTSVVSIPFDKIQQVSFKRGILQRIIGVYAVVVDTAGSKEKEVVIDALSEEIAEGLVKELQRLKGFSSEVDANAESDEAIQNETTVKYLYKVDFPTLLKAGLSANFFRGFFLLFAFGSTVYNEINQFFKDQLSGFLDSSADTLTHTMGASMLFFGILVVAILLVSMVITTGEVLLKHFNLQLKQTQSHLELSMGLRTQTKVSLHAKRVQMFHVVTNPIQKRLKLCKAVLELASSQDRQKKDNIQIPALNTAALETVQSFLGTEAVSGKVFKPHKITLVKRCAIGSIPLVAALLVTTFLNAFNAQILAGMFIYALLCTLLQMRIYKSLQLTIGSDFITKHIAIWDETTTRFPIFKLQSVTVSQPFWYRNRNLVNLTFHTAAGDVHFKALDSSVLSYINYSLYVVETSKTSWM